MSVRYLWPVLFAFALLLAACADEGQPSLTSGIRGQVLIGPTCPVVRQGSPCPDAPFQASVEVWNADRTDKITTFRTDEDGRFRVPLPPGEYLLEPLPPNPGVPPTPESQTVTVPAAGFVAVTLHFDTGIRLAGG
ncbi:MAG: carboxypeptidase regulatory-like domain-containing protein [Chloroflexi bacterium]|nr:carboxypeptidase regulatory-like domain-containing protein [Chloroflexota bacterium]